MAALTVCIGDPGIPAPGVTLRVFSTMPQNVWRASRPLDQPGEKPRMDNAKLDFSLFRARMVKKPPIDRAKKRRFTLRRVIYYVIHPKRFWRRVSLTRSGGKKGTFVSRTFSYLDELEAESIFFIRQAVAQTENPVMMYSIGKDSTVMLELALRAFAPMPLPFPLLHIDTTWKFREMIEFRDQTAKRLGLHLIVHTNQEGLRAGVSPFSTGSARYTDIMKTDALKQALNAGRFDLAFGGARRDEEKSRAKERVFSFRDSNHRWDPRNQRPELWNLFNTNRRAGESIRVFPLSNWTELDVWRYIQREGLAVVPLYFAKARPVVERNGLVFMVDDERFPLNPGEQPELRKIRFRTLGCYPLSAGVVSEAQSIEDILHEMETTSASERVGRVIDFDQGASMERKKQEGYF